MAGEGADGCCARRQTEGGRRDALKTDGLFCPVTDHTALSEQSSSSLQVGGIIISGQSEVSEVGRMGNDSRRSRYETKGRGCDHRRTRKHMRF